MDEDARWIAIHDAFDRHCRELHNADFEVCDDPTCQAAWGLECQLMANEVTHG